MKTGRIIKFLIGVAVLLTVGLPSLSLAEDIIPLEGRRLTEQEMAATRGGFSLNDGSFITFSLDLLRFNFLSDGQSEVPDTFFNAVSQRGIITENGMQLDINVAKGGDMYDMYGSEGQHIDVIDTDIVAINDAFKNISGLSNIAVVAGDGNTVINNIMMKLDVGFYGVKDIASFNAMNFMRQ